MNARNTAVTPDSLLEKVMDRLPAVQHAIASSGHLTLQQYLDELIATVPQMSPTAEPFLDVLHRHTESALGPKLANKVCDDLGSCPAVLSAHHFGVDSLAQSLQSCLFFARRKVGGRSPLTVPVFAFGNVSLNTLTYPAGLLIYELGDRQPRTWPQKLRIFPDRLKRASVYSAPAYDASMCQRAKAQLRTMAQRGFLPDAFCRTGCSVIDEIYLPGTEVGHTFFSDQAPRLNHALWNRVFPDVPLVFLQIESLAAELFEQDALDSSSLIARLLFHEECLHRLIAELEADDLISTHFFWGIDAKARNFALSYRDGQLNGTDLNGNAYRVAFQPDALIGAMRAREILPATFTSFVVMSFDRGICGFGGYHQAMYLPKMCRAVQRVLATTGSLSPVPTSLYLSGMQAMVDPERRFPLGLLEMIHRGGVSAARLDQAMQVTVTEAHMASLTDTLFDLFPREYDRMAVLRSRSERDPAIRVPVSLFPEHSVGARSNDHSEGAVQL